MKNRLLNSVLCVFLGLGLSACATHELLSKNQSETKTITKTKRHNLIEDKVLAFAKPATPLPTVPSDSIVIVGEKQSYVLTQGASDFVGLIGKLDAKYIKLTRNLDFRSENDGKFEGSLNFKYRKLAEDLTKAEREYFLQYKVQECSDYNDKELKAQSFCFEIPLKGVIFPVVNNLAGVKKLSKAYPISIYTEKETVTTQYQPESGKSVARKLILLPFAVAFDVVTLPLQAIWEIFD